MKKSLQYLLFQISITSSFSKNILFFILLLTSSNLLAQRDAIFKKDSTEIRCKIIKTTKTKYKYIFINNKQKLVKSYILKSAIDSVKYNKYDTDLNAAKLFKPTVPVAEQEEEQVKPYQFTFGIGLNLGNILEFNSTTGVDKKSFSATTALDLGLDYSKEGNRFAMTNELHWTIAIQKSGLTNATHIQRVTDDLTTLHDFSFAISKNNKWNFNLIVKTNTSIFTIFDGDYFKDFNNNGKTQSFLNPYEITLSPGIKYQPNDYFRLSISPYSVSLYGLTSQQIANTGFYTQTFDANNNYDLFVFKQLGAEINIWYDRKIKKWLEMQYRLGISSDYFSNIAKNGLMNGLFITKVKIIKNVSLTHRAILKGDFTSKPFKPYYNQVVLLSFAKSF
ncbi:hypothetical protein [Flavobacterium sp.]|uniref:hypothetical protein n=1 Tax=Flavobacterium sp. TaxID=239 RepID=UPI001B4F842B|nr:hypothetical protein [Flavobacterium sp.]MBP6181884.1 hypothetical protein [Flavobacterium sp.]